MTFRNSIKAILLTTIMIALASCGGGGGGGSSSGGSGTPGSGSGGGGSPTISGLPSVVALSFSEESEVDALNGGERFNITVSDPNQDPTNFRLVGADAEFFEVTVSIQQSGSSANAFELVLGTSVLTALDFENPSDIGMDNLYNFDLAFEYAGQTYEIPFEVSITDIAERIQVTIGFFEDLTRGLKSVPDYSGDANPEVLLGEISSAREVLSSESIETSRNTLTGFFGGFLTTSRDPEDDTSDILSFDLIQTSTGSLNVLVQPSISGSDIKLFDLSTAEDFEILRGPIKASIEHSSEISYGFPDDGLNRFPHFNLTSDINGDGLNEIIYSVGTEESGSGQRVRTYGIVFGRAATSQADRNRIIDPDVILNLNPNSSASSNSGIEVFRVPDMDGDGIEELIIDDRVASGIDANTEQPVANGVYSFVYSTTVNSGGNEIDLWNLDAGEGFQLYDTSSGLGGLSALNSTVTVASDYDNDGTNSIVIPFPNGALVADEDELVGLSSSSDVRQLPGFLTFPDSSFDSATAVGDLNMDGQSEIMYDRGIILGNNISEYFMSADPVLDSAEAVEFDIAIGGNTRVERIIDLPDQGLLALSGFDGTFLVERVELEDALTQANIGLTFIVGN